ATFANDPVVLLTEAELVHLFFEKERGVANIFHFDPTHHLTNDGLNVLVVVIHALQAVNLLNRVHEVSLSEFFAQHGQQIVEVERAVNQSFASLDALAFLHVDVHTARQRIFLGGFSVFAFDENLAQALADFTVAPTPSTSLMTAGSLGLRVSNSSTTRGR